MARLKARLAELIRADDRSLLPAGVDWPTACARAMHAAVQELASTLGPDVAAWRWGRLHATRPRHPLADACPGAASRLDPPAVAVGGDGDTVNAAGYTPAAGFTVTLTSVARYVFDLGDWERSAWVVPLGASGRPGDPHFADQVEAWAACRLFPMRYAWDRIAKDAASHLTLAPA
jgi:penicillin amidase